MKSIYQVPILMYHYFCPDNHDINQFRSPLYILDEKTFRIQMQYLKDNKYTPISLYQFRDYIQEGGELPDKSVIITFDGGCMEWYTISFPILKQLNFKATFFVITDWVGNHPFGEVNPISWKELREIGNYRNEEGEYLFNVESHTASHSRLIRNPNESLEEYESRLRYELEHSKRCLDIELRQSTRFLALPDGRAGGLDENASFIRQLAKKYGYWGIRTSNSDYPNNKHVDLFRLGSQCILSSYNLAHFVYHLEKYEMPFFINIARIYRCKISTLNQIFHSKGFHGVLRFLWRKVRRIP